MPGRTIILKTRTDFQKFLAFHPNLVVQAGATWCRPCKVISPLVNSVFSRMPATLHLVKVDVTLGIELATYLNITAVPCFMAFIRGTPAGFSKDLTSQGIQNFFTSTAAKITKIK